MIRWDVFPQSKQREPFQRPTRVLPYARIKSNAVLERSRCSAAGGQSARDVLWEPQGRGTAPGDPVGES